MISIWEMILGLGFKALLSGQTASAIRREHQKGHYNHACDIWLLHIPSSHLKCRLDISDLITLLSLSAPTTNGCNLEVQPTHTVTLRSGQLSPKVPPCSLKVMRFQTATTVSSGTLKWNSSTLAKERQALSLRGVRVKQSVTNRQSREWNKERVIQIKDGNRLDEGEAGGKRVGGISLNAVWLTFLSESPTSDLITLAVGHACFGFDSKTQTLCKINFVAILQYKAREEAAK